ncbi:MAG: thioredoxin domain-containing protein [Bdellovibrionota bacterium]
MTPIIASTKTSQTQEISELHWLSSIEEALSDQSKLLTMVDLYADWCAACKELELITFSDPLVKSELSKFKLVKVDFTQLDDQATSITEKYNVLGLPCILFLNPDGQEISGSRINGFLEPQDFIKHLKAKIPT